MSSSAYIHVGRVTDLDNPPHSLILSTSINPVGLPKGLNGNRCIVIQHDFGIGDFCAQLAFSFGSDKIAIRRKLGSTNWSDWKYFTAQ